MTRRSNESYVVVFEQNSAVAVQARRATYPKLPGDFTTRDAISVGKLISDAFRCRRGDPRIGMDPDIPRRDAMSATLNRLRGRHALSIWTRKRPPKSRRR
jgi:hypothetical protein